MTPEEVRALVRRGVAEGFAKVWTREVDEAVNNDIWNKGNTVLFDEILAAGYVRHDPANPGRKTLEDEKKHVVKTREGYADIHLSFDYIIDTGSEYAMRWTWSGNHVGVSPTTGLPASGKRVALTGITIGRRGSDGKVVEEWVEQDTLGLIRQIKE